MSTQVLNGILSPLAPPTEDEIAVAAYLDWCGRGRPEGDDWADWFAARLLNLRQQVMLDLCSKIL